MIAVSKIQINGLKGVQADIDIQQNKLAIAGKSGAGKSTVLDGFRFATLQHNRLGSTDLRRFSASGSWTVSVVIGGVTFTAGQGARSSVWAIDGVPVQESAYREAMGRILQPDDVSDMGAFIALSDKKRSELFAELLGSKSVSIAEIVFTATASVAADWWGPSKCLVDMEFKGTSNEVVEYVRGTSSGWQSALRLRQNELQALMGEDTDGTPVEAVADLESQVATLLKEIGGIDSEIAEGESRKKAHEAAQKSLRLLQGQVEQLTTVREQIPAKEEHVKACELSRRTAASQREAAILLEESTRSAIANNQSMPKALTAFVSKLRAGDFKNEFVQAFGSEWPDVDSVAQFIEHCVLGIGTSTPILQEQLRQHHETTVTISARWEQAGTALATAVADLGRSKKSIDSLPDLEKSLTETSAQIQGVASSVDLEAVAGQKAQKELAITELRARITASRNAQQKAARIADLRRDLAGDVARGDRLKELLTVLTTWKDKFVGDAAGAIKGQMSERYAVFFPGALVDVVSTKKGMDVRVQKRGRPMVSIDDLSDGESVLFAASMLPLLQRGAFKMLTLNAEAADAASMERLLRAQSPWADFMIITDNSMPAEVARECGWQVVVMDELRRVA